MNEQTPPSASMSEARARLSSALENLEARLSDLADQMQQLDAARSENDSLKSDLDAAREREAEFSDLAEETTRELDKVIAEVRDALGEE